MSNTPRLMIAAPRSGTGKTTLTCALLQALVNRGKKPMACKCGPDYIDPLFHSRIIGANSGNLDLFFADSDTNRWMLKERSIGCDVTVIEGAMGYYDGIALSSEASAYDMAKATDTPVILVLDGRGVSVSICAEILGFMTYRKDSCISGVILNRVSSMFYPRLKAAIEAQCGIPVCGYLPPLSDCLLESRHLGLVTPDDVSNLKAKLMKLAECAEKTLDIDALLSVADSAPDLMSSPPVLPERVRNSPVVAVAQDAAFCFYYQESLQLLRELGGVIVPFSPLSDRQLPECAALLIGGGYPELHAKSLSENAGMREQIRQAVLSGMPTIAECGGFMYLHETLEDSDGRCWPMVGSVPGRCYPTGKLGRFGYVTITAKKDGFLFRSGDQMRAHEFHYWDSEHPGDSLRAEKPQTQRGWDCGVISDTLYAGYPHLHFYSNPTVAFRFLKAAEQYQEIHRK